MNDPNENLPYELLEDLLQPLRDARPPVEAQAANRSAVRQALAKQLRPAWWRRTIAVPIPVAIAASILLLLATIALARPSLLQRDIEERLPQVTAQSLALQSATPETTTARDDAYKPTWTIQRSFIRTLTSSTANGFPNSNVMENRDDS